MYAIIETGGKQYRVSEGDTIFVEKLDAQEGDVVTIDRVLGVKKDNDFVAGSPVVDNAKVTLKVEKQGRAKKIIVYKYKAKKIIAGSRAIVSHLLRPRWKKSRRNR